MKRNVFTKVALTTTTVVTCAVLMTGCGPSESIKYYNYNNPNASANVDESPYLEKSYSHLGYSERTEVLGMLEKYAVENNLTGITLYEDGGYAMYNPRLDLSAGATKYIAGYGWGTLTEGKITAPLSGQTNANWNMYYHDYDATDPKTLNYMDDKGSVVSGFNSHVTAGYWTTILNETKDGYSWVNQLANSMPVPTNKNEFGLSDTYKFEVSNDMLYSTLSTKEGFKEFNNRQVQLQDYVTPYLQMYNQKNALARGSENLGNSSSIKGLDKYYNATKDDKTLEELQALFNELVGLKATEEDGKFFLEVTFETAIDSFYAMYYLASGMMTPVPQSFVDKCGGMKNVGKFNADGSLSPVDTFLSTGQFVTEVWAQDKEIVMKKNSNFVGAKKNTNLYQIAGIHYAILPAAKENPETGFNEFIANKIDATGIPSSKLDEFKSDPRTKRTIGGTTTKLNVNALDQETWIEMFGENGSVSQTTPDNYWQCEPMMSNDDFLAGLSYSINRTEFANKRGSHASVDFFGSAYLSNPLEGTVYGSTNAHKDAISSLVEGTDGFGYSLSLAKTAFAEAAKTLTDDGTYKKGDIVNIDIVWQSQGNVTYWGNDLATYFEAAFNGSEAKTKYGLTLKVNHIVPNVWSDAYYKHMLVGQFDLGFGSISGNSLNPLGFMDNLKSSGETGFTLNWSCDTNEVSEDLFYDGQYWSYDALWSAFDNKAVVKTGTLNGKVTNTEFIVSEFEAELKSSQMDEKTGERTVSYVFDLRADYTLKVNKISVITYGEDGKPVFNEITCKVENGVITFVMPKEFATLAQGSIQVYLEFDILDNDGNKISDNYLDQSHVFDVLLRS